MNAIKVQIGDLSEIAGRLYDVVPDKRGGATLEPAITTTVDEILAAHGGRGLTAEEFEEHFGDLPSDGEGLAPRRRTPMGSHGVHDHRAGVRSAHVRPAGVGEPQARVRGHAR